MAIEIVDFPIKNGDFPWQNVTVHQAGYLYLPPLYLGCLERPYMSVMMASD